MDKDLKATFLNSLKQSFIDGLFIKLTLGKYRGSDADTAKNIYIREVLIGDQKKLAFTYRFPKKDIIKNYTIDESVGYLRGLLGNDYLSGEMFTVNSNSQLIYSKKRIPRLNTSKPTMKKDSLDELHNRTKNYFLSKDRDFLNILGVSTQDGKIKSDKYSKYRQINKFVEILDSEVESSNLDLKGKVNVWDMGSGKSYLTFATYDYLNNLKGVRADVRGIEFRKDMVDISNQNANSLGFERLKFIEGSIQNVDISGANIVIALHACDTATDDAIAKALLAKAEVIVVAPCCHKYVRNSIGVDSALKSIIKHGILEERIAESLTDGLRALVLESYGYKTKVFEFASKEHTGKNVMITAIRGSVSDEYRGFVLSEISRIKKEFGLRDFYLDKCLA
jgi:hypothetical protein